MGIRLPHLAADRRVMQAVPSLHTPDFYNVFHAAVVMPGGSLSALKLAFQQNFFAFALLAVIGALAIVCISVRPQPFVTQPDVAGQRSL